MAALSSRPARSRALLVAGTAAAAVAVTGLTATSASADSYSSLRQCESGGNYSTNTGNGYYGAYQFDQRTWNGLGYSGRPDQASAATQDAAARQLQAQRGWSPWPSCSRKIGLNGGGGSAASASTARASRSTERVAVRSTKPAAKKAAASRPKAVAHRPTAVPVPAPAVPTELLTIAMVGQPRDDVRAWQARLGERGWTLAADGRFGPRTEAIVKAFQIDKALPVTGVIDAVTWDRAWTAEVTA